MLCEELVVVLFDLMARGKIFAFSFFFSSRRRHTRSLRDWSSDVCSSDLWRGWRACAPAVCRSRSTRECRARSSAASCSRSPRRSASARRCGSCASSTGSSACSSGPVTRPTRCARRSCPSSGTAPSGWPGCISSRSTSSSRPGSGRRRRHRPARPWPDGGSMTNHLDELARLGSATVYEGGGRIGFVDADLVQVIPGSRVAGPARTVACAQGDNLMVHAAMAELQPGEVLVLTMPEPAPVALVGDLLATQAKVHGAAALLIDAAIRDREELVELGLPIWARWVRVKGADKDTAGTIGEPVSVGGVTINT